MKKPSRTLQSQWAARLKSSGFKDLEGPGGVLSNRGNITTGDLASYDGERIRQMTPESRAETETYYDNARDIARSHYFPRRIDRQVWALHADRFGRADIAERLGIGERQVRESMARTRAAIERVKAKEGNQGNQGNQMPRKQLDRLVRALDVEMLVSLAGAFA